MPNANPRGLRMFKASDYVNLLLQLEQFFTETAQQKPIVEGSC